MTEFIGLDVEDAVCRSVDPEMWFPGKGISMKDAIALCRTCPLVEPCADYALHNTVKGVWGATNERMRRDLQRELGIKPRFLDVEYGAA